MLLRIESLNINNFEEHPYIYITLFEVYSVEFPNFVSGILTAITSKNEAIEICEDRYEIKRDEKYTDSNIADYIPWGSYIEEDNSAENPIQNKLYKAQLFHENQLLWEFKGKDMEKYEIGPEIYKKSHLVTEK